MVISPMGEMLMTGLVYSDVQAGLAMAGISMNEDLFGELRLIERGALDALAEARK